MIMERLCDLHTHSIFSDGTDTPAAIIDKAEVLGLSGVALCDHNTVDGLPEWRQAAVGKPVEAVCGAEFSVAYEGAELHLLGLYIDPMHFDRIHAEMQQVNARKEQSNRRLIASLCQAGYVLDYDAVCASTPNGKFNRGHVATALTEAGYTASVAEAFDTLLSPEAGHYVEPERLTVWEMLAILCEIGAVPVLAHPLLNLDEARLRSFLPLAKAHGLRGMEVFYSEYDVETTALAADMAQRYSLLPSGGSDYHGTRKQGIALGVGRGNLRIPYTWAEALAP